MAWTPAVVSLYRNMRRVRDNAIGSLDPALFEDWVRSNRVLWLRTFVLNHPDAIRHVLRDNAQNYVKSGLTRRLLDPVVGKGVLLAEGAAWHRQRRMMAPSFDARSIAGYTPTLVRVAEEVAERWRELPPGAVVDVGAEMMRATARIISETMFSSDAGRVLEFLEEGVARYQESVRPTIFDALGFPRWLVSRRRDRLARRLLEPVETEFAELIAERRKQVAAGEAKPDLLGRLLAARDEETGQGMGDAEVREQLLTIFFAGHETTSVALMWTWYLLSCHPQEEAKLQAELSAVLGGRSPGHEDLPRLGYVRQVFEESLRLYPPVHTLSTRVALADDRVGETLIPKGAFVVILPWVVHRHRKLWPDPERFDPERFAPERVKERSRYAYLPFSAGPRSCLGAAFALTEGVLILATLAARFRLRLAPGHRVEPRGLITLRARYGMKMVLEPRSGSS